MSVPDPLSFDASRRVGAIDNTDVSTSSIHAEDVALVGIPISLYDRPEAGIELRERLRKALIGNDVEVENFEGTTSLGWIIEDLSLTGITIDIESRRRTREGLIDILNSFQDLGDDWNSYGASAPHPLSIKNAKALLNKLPIDRELPRVSIGGDGELTFSWQRIEKKMFLTIERNRLHLLVKHINNPNEYFDNLPYAGGPIPSDILTRLPQS